MTSPFTQTILVTGAGGQLGSELRNLSTSFSEYKFLFAGRQELPVEDSSMVSKFFKQNKIGFCINCAAYTAVDKAESERDIAFKTNGTAVGELASVCKNHRTKLIHISTDYVYDGTKRTPLKETDPVLPLSAYGKSKLKGEELALTVDPEAIIIRTSWVYSFYGYNFLKTMIRLMGERPELNIVSDQVGCPTSAADLAGAIMLFIARISSGKHFTGIYNYSNEGNTTWYQYAKLIKETIDSECKLNPVLTSQYPAIAIRPAYSVLDTSKIKNALNVEIPFWKDSVTKCIQRLMRGKMNDGIL